MLPLVEQYFCIMTEVSIIMQIWKCYVLMKRINFLEISLTEGLSMHLDFLVNMLWDQVSNMRMLWTVEWFSYQLNFFLGLWFPPYSTVCWLNLISSVCAIANYSISSRVACIGDMKSFIRCVIEKFYFSEIFPYWTTVKPVVQCPSFTILHSQ